MIDVGLYKAKSNAILQKNGTFIEGELYFGRLSKDGHCYVMKSEEGFWIPVERYRWAKRGNRTTHFERKGTLYIRNRKRLNDFDSVKSYLDDESNYRKWWYATVLRDKYLFTF